ILAVTSQVERLIVNWSWGADWFVLVFNCRSRRSSLQLMDSAGLILEQIALNPSDYCPYSATGNYTGGMVYANYGRPEDFNWLKSVGVSAASSVVVMRVGGGVSFAEKVWLAERNGAGGVLIYPDPADLPQDPRRLGLNSHTAVSEHVSPPSITLSKLRPLILPAQVQLSGPPCPPSWRGRLPYVRCVLGPEFSSGRRVRISVHNTMTPVLLNNIFSSLEGRGEPDQYVILGAQRDSLGPGAVKSGVGTAILLELARTFSAMVKNGFSPRRSLLFVSWDAGDFGNVGATEWLEGYLSMLHLKAVAYFSLDQAIMGKAISQPIRELGSSNVTGCVFHQVMITCQAITTSQKPLWLTSHSFIPSLLFQERAYPFLNTPLDSVPRLQEVLGGRLGVTGRSLSELVGEMVLRLVHDRILPLRITSYAQTVLQFSAHLNKHSAELQSRGVSPQWLFSARGDYSRAAETLQRAIDYSDLHDPTTARLYNTRIMKVRGSFRVSGPSVQAIKLEVSFSLSRTCSSVCWTVHDGQVENTWTKVID
uniref:Transferrin receptor 2 n=1 Tax=Fundulus heteroclitus TaxID=8078 RepID=A0A3Q2PX87_FUNHE